MAGRSSVPPPEYTEISSYNLCEDTEIVYDDDLRELNELCLPKWSRRADTRRTDGRRIARPERPEYATVMGLPPNPRWTSVLVHLRDDLRRHGIPLRHVHTARWKLMAIVASILYCRECDPRLSLHATPEAAPDYAVLEKNFDIRMDASIELRRNIEEASRYMLLDNYGGSNITVLRPIEQSECMAALHSAESVVTFATHFRHYWSSMDLGQRWESVHCVAGINFRMDPSDYGILLYNLHT
ncbi:uncharacterized protein PG986_000480 [Apiospora aurea]|uniref:Uncharacterized protein n=1 Tax=Apiospora aurea TaxID=335848 RepID=A0ABR1QU75_9PEZI